MGAREQALESALRALVAHTDELESHQADYHQLAEEGAPWRSEPLNAAHAVLAAPSAPAQEEVEPNYPPQADVNRHPAPAQGGVNVSEIAREITNQIFTTEGKQRRTLTHPEIQELIAAALRRALGTEAGRGNS
jgi:hypothetical protein